eukprot:RCo050532
MLLASNRPSKSPPKLGEPNGTVGPIDTLPPPPQPNRAERSPQTAPSYPSFPTPSSCSSGYGYVRGSSARTSAALAAAAASSSSSSTSSRRPKSAGATVLPSQINKAEFRLLSASTASSISAAPVAPGPSSSPTPDAVEVGLDSDAEEDQGDLGAPSARRPSTSNSLRASRRLLPARPGSAPHFNRPVSYPVDTSNLALFSSIESIKSIHSGEQAESPNASKAAGCGDTGAASAAVTTEGRAAAAAAAALPLPPSPPPAAAGETATARTERKFSSGSHAEAGADPLPFPSHGLTPRAPAPAPAPDALAAPVSGVAVADYEDDFEETAADHDLDDSAREEGEDSSEDAEEEAEEEDEEEEPDGGGGQDRWVEDEDTADTPSHASKAWLPPAESSDPLQAWAEQSHAAVEPLHSPTDNLAVSKAFHDDLCAANWLVRYEDIEVMEQLGSGSFGTVFRGRMKRSKDLVAFKVFAVQDADMVASFRREVKMLSTLRHEHIVVFRGACIEIPHMCIVTEYMSQGNLYTKLHNEEETLPWSLLIRWVRDIARGMNYLHTLCPPVIHRDLKSPNVLINDYNMIKLCDFGMARTKQQTVIHTKGMGGSPLWMAPECLRGEAFAEKSDVYSFGVVMWEILTREVPWEDKEMIQLIGLVGFRHQTLKIPPPRKWPKGCPQQYVSIMQSTWKAVPQDRPSFADLVPVFEDLAMMHTR